MIRGDLDKETPFLLMGGDPANGAHQKSDLAKDLWTQEQEALLLSGNLDVLVHCLKDLPSTLPEGTLLEAFLEREDPRDALTVSSVDLDNR